MVYFTHLNYRGTGSKERLAHHPGNPLCEGKHQAENRDEEGDDEREELEKEIEDVAEEFHARSIANCANTLFC